MQCVDLKLPDPPSLTSHTMLLFVFLQVSWIIFFDLIYYLQCITKEGEIDTEDLIGCRIKVWWPMDKK